jgi:hypothetical protein
MVKVLWRLAVRRLAPRQLDALTGRGGKPDWSIVLRRGFTLGFLGGSNLWIALGGLAAVVQAARKLGEGHGKVLLVERLSPGQALSIVDTNVTRKALRRAGRRRA